MQFKMFFIRMIIRLQPKRRQELKEEMLSNIRKLLDLTIDAGSAASIPIPKDDFKAIVLDSAIRSFAHLMGVVGASKAELVDVITGVFNAREKEEG